MCLYKRIADVSDELLRMGKIDLVNELNDVCDQIDSIDRELEDAEENSKIIPKVRERLYGATG